MHTTGLTMDHMANITTIQSTVMPTMTLTTLVTMEDVAMMDQATSMKWRQGLD